MTAPSAQRDERGAIATIVAVLFSAGVMLGVLALTVDVGRVVLERGELQNGADAGALALAQSCASAACSAGADGLAAVVNGNADDGQHRIVGQCARNADTALPGCPTGSGALTDCAALPPGTDGTDSYVEVRTRTSSEGRSFIRNIFGGAAGGTAGSTVDACARAGWGAPSSARVAPIAISSCEFERAGGFGPAHETALASEYVSGEDPCPDADILSTGMPGGLGGLDRMGCAANVRVGRWVRTREAANTSCLQPGDVVYVAVSDCVSSATQQPCDIAATGGTMRQRIEGVAAFYVTANDLPGPSSPAVPGYRGPDQQAACAERSADGVSCLYGWFVRDRVLDGTIDPSGTNYGVQAVQLLG